MSPLLFSCLLPESDSLYSNRVVAYCKLVVIFLSKGTLLADITTEKHDTPFSGNY